MHIAILDTDVPVPTVYAKDGLYSTRFRTLLRAAASRLKQSHTIPNDTTVHTSAYDTSHGVYPPDETLRTSKSTSPNDTDNNTVIDAILITGSVKGVYDTESWIKQLGTYIRHVFDSFPLVKIFGSCFGHQAIANVLLSDSVRVEKCPLGRETGIVPIALDERFCQLVPHFVADREGDDSGNERRRKRELRLQLVHGDWVVPREYPASGTGTGTGMGTLPEPWVNLGSSDICPIQGLYYPGRVFSLQGHFEFDSFINRETVRTFGSWLGWDSSVVEGFVEQIDISTREGGDDDDSNVAAEAVLLFFLS